jgi:hypothetical protein
MPARGRPVGSSPKAWADAVRKASHALDTKTKTKKLDLLALSLVSAGLEGDVSALKEIGDRLDGKVPQAVTGEGGGPIAMAIQWLPSGS